MAADKGVARDAAKDGSDEYYRTDRRTVGAGKLATTPPPSMCCSTPAPRCQDESAVRKRFKQFCGVTG